MDALRFETVSRSAVFFLVAAAFATGCSDDPHLRTTRAITGDCIIAPGEIPRADCSASRSTTTASATTAPTSCHVAASCGDETTCLPLASNADKDTLDFRIRRLNVLMPDAFASDPLATELVTDRVDLDAAQCGESGLGAFNWLVRIDRTRGTLTTGGAPPVSNPLSDGFCFASYRSAGTSVAPVVAPVSEGNGKFTTMTSADLAIPIFHGRGSDSAIVLRIRDARFQDVTVSSDRNCIGSFNASALDATCTEDRSGAPKWSTAGALAGFMTLEDADAVMLSDLDGDSMCVAILGIGVRDDATHKCVRDANGHLPAAGDYCSLTRSPGGCRDSVWFAATFAASAVRITSGDGVAMCEGATTP